jgi:hypothetical protein
MPAPEITRRPLGLIGITGFFGETKVQSTAPAMLFGVVVVASGSASAQNPGEHVGISGALVERFRTYAYLAMSLAAALGFVIVFAGRRAWREVDRA